MEPYSQQPQYQTGEYANYPPTQGEPMISPQPQYPPQPQ